MIGETIEGTETDETIARGREGTMTTMDLRDTNPRGTMSRKDEEGTNIMRDPDGVTMKICADGIGMRMMAVHLASTMTIDCATRTSIGFVTIAQDRGREPHCVGQDPVLQYRKESPSESPEYYHCADTKLYPILHSISCDCMHICCLASLLSPTICHCCLNSGGKTCLA